jgi:hypothetical protein
MWNYKIIFLSFFIFSIITPVNIYPQDPDIVAYLKQIEDGNKDQVKDELASLKEKYHGSSSVLFLEGVLTGDGPQAVSIYTDLLKNFPQSRYADASLYRICTYYYAVGRYSLVKSNLAKLKKDFPQSPYIKLMERNIPDDDIVSVETNNEAADTGGENIYEPADSESYNYTIQAGAFIIAGNAQVLKTELDSAGYDASIRKKTIAGTSFNILYVGKFVNREDAKNTLALINKKYFLNGRIISINSK